MSRKPNGFSLIELLMVVTIILVIAALAIPSFMRSRMTANETSAVASLRAIFTANTTYETSYGNGYSPDLPSLAGTPPATCAGADLIDGLLATGQKSGYAFTYVAGAVIPVGAPGCTPGAVAFTVQATPLVAGSSGQRSFCIDETGVVRFDQTGAIISAPCGASGAAAVQ
jgi:type IV pilus assembly protein PilA